MDQIKLEKSVFSRFKIIQLFKIAFLSNTFLYFSTEVLLSNTNFNNFLNFLIAEAYLLRGKKDGVRL